MALLDYWLGSGPRESVSRETNTKTNKITNKRRISVFCGLIVIASQFANRKSSIFVVVVVILIYKKWYLICWLIGLGGLINDLIAAAAENNTKADSSKHSRPGKPTFDEWFGVALLPSWHFRRSCLLFLCLFLFRLGSNYVSCSRRRSFGHRVLAMPRHNCLNLTCPMALVNTKTSAAEE